VSVLVPIFNVEHYLDQCLSSISLQTLRDIEIICINDGSTDNSLAIVQRHAANDPRLIVIDKPNSGYGDTMNKGLEVATGEYVGIVESDDFVDAGCFAELYRLAKRHDADVVKAEYWRHRTDITSASQNCVDKLQAAYDRETNMTVRSHDYKSMALSNFQIGNVIYPRQQQSVFRQQPAIWAGIYRRTFIVENAIKFLPTPGASYQDTSFAFKVWATARRVVFSDQAYLHYRLDNGASSVNSAAKAFAVRDEFAEIERFLTERGLFAELSEMMFLCRLDAYRWNFYRLADGQDEEFVLAASQQFRDDDRRHLINWASWDTNTIREVREIIGAPHMVVARKRAKAVARVSVIVPMFNVGNYLTQCLESIVGQTFDDLEIILVDDESTDDTLAIAETFWARDPRIILISQAHAGQSVARNNALQHQSAPFVMFCDGDDYYEIDAVATLLDRINQTGADLVACGVDVFYDDDADSSEERQRSDAEFYTLKLDGHHQMDTDVIASIDASVWNKLFRRSQILKANLSFPAGLSYEDYYFTMAYAAQAKTITFAKDRLLCHYRRHAGSIMADTFSKSSRAVDHTRVYVLLVQYLLSHGAFARYEDFWVDEFKRCTDISILNSPPPCLNDIVAIVTDFLNRNGRALDKINPTIRPRMRAAIEPTANRVGITFERTNMAKRIGNGLLLRLNPTYRKQVHSLTILNAVNEVVNAQAAQLRDLQRDVSAMKRQIERMSSRDDNETGN